MTDDEPRTFEGLMMNAKELEAMGIIELDGDNVKISETFSELFVEYLGFTKNLLKYLKIDKPTDLCIESAILLAYQDMARDYDWDSIYWTHIEMIVRFLEGDGGRTMRNLIHIYETGTAPPEEIIE